MGKTFRLLSLFVLGGWLFGAGASTAQTLPAPLGFAAAPQNGQASLQWTPEPSATAYSLIRNVLPVSGAVTPTPVATIPAFSSSYVDSQVTNGRTYEYLLSGIASGVTGTASAVTVTPFSPPAAIDTLTVENNVSNALVLTWLTPLSTYPVTEYQVYRYAAAVTSVIATVTLTPGRTPGPVSAATVLALSPTPYAVTTETQYTDKAVSTPGNSYFYYIALSKDSASPPNGSQVPAFSSAPAFPTPQPPLAPQLSAFTNSSATPVIGVGGYGIRLIWNGPQASEAVTAYQVLRNDTPVATLSVTTPTPTYVYDDTAIAFSSSAVLPYDYAVSALSAQGGTSSNTVPVSFYAASGVDPVVVTPDATTGAVTVSWNEGFGGSYLLAGYRIYKSLKGPYFTPEPTPTGTLAAVPTATVTPTPFATVLLTPLAVATTQVIDAASGNGNGLSYWVEPFDTTSHKGNIGVATPSVLVLAPTPVSNLQVTGPTGNNKMVVNWSGAGDGFYGPIQDYAIYREVAATFQTVTPTPIATVGADQSSFTDFISGASPGTNYLYQVGAQDAKGNISDLTLTSNQVAVTTQMLPAAPQLLALAGDGNSLTYSWLLNPLSDAVTQYTVYGPDWPTLAMTPTPLATVLATPSSYSFTRAAAPWQASVYYLLAKNAQGYSQAATLTGVNIPSYQVTAVMTPGSQQMRVYWNVTPTITATPGFVPVDAYGLYRSLTPGANFTPIATIPAGTAVFKDVAANLNPGAFYYYRITARADSGGQLLAESPLYPNFPNPTPVPEAGNLTWPNPPQGFSAAGGVTSTALNWFPNDASEQVTSYLLFKGSTLTPVVIPAGTPVAVATATFALQWQATETPGAVSSYQLEAVNHQGPSTFSSSQEVLSANLLTPTVGFTPPPGFSPTPSTTPSRLVWISGLTYSGPVSGYTIYSSTQPGVVAPSVVAQVSAPTSFVSDSGVPGFVTYYQAVPNNNLGLSANLNAVASTPVTMWPNPPVPYLLSSGDSAITLAWATPMGDVPVTGYQIFRSTSAGFTPTPMAAPFPAATLVAVDAQVTPALAYYYSMTASNAGGAGSLSTAQGFLPIQPPVLQVTPSAVRNQLVWAQFSPTMTPSPGSVSGFAIYRAVPTPGMTPTYSLIGQVSGAAVTTFSDTTVADSGTYLYEVAATSGQAFGGLSNAVTAVVVPVPVILTPIPGDGLVQLRWDYQGAPVTSVSYTLWRKLGTDPSPLQIIKTGITGVDYTDTGLLDKTFYIYELETVDALSGATTFSDPVTALPAAPPVVQSGAVTVSQPGNLNVLSWYPANQQFPLISTPVTVFDPTTMYPLGGYIVYQSVDGGATYDESVHVALSGPTSVTYTDNVPVIGGQTYTYLVQAYDVPPDAPMTFAHFSSYNLVTAFPVGPSTALDLNAIRPNDGAPFVHMRLAVAKAGMVTIRVYSLSGIFIKQLFHQNMNVGVYYKDGAYPGLSWDGKNMNGSFVADGVYLITTEMADHQEIDKVALIK